MNANKRQIGKFMFIVYMIIILTILSIKGFSQNITRSMTFESCPPSVYDQFCKQKYKAAITELTLLGFATRASAITTAAPYYYNTTLSGAILVLHFFATRDAYATRLPGTLYTSDPAIRSVVAPVVRMASLSTAHTVSVAGTTEYQPGKFR